MKLLKLNMRLAVLCCVMICAVFASTVALAAETPKITYGAGQDFVAAAGYPTPPYPLTVRLSDFSPSELCWGVQLYDEATGTYGPYDPSLTPPIFPADPGFEGGDNCMNPAAESLGVVTSVARAPNLYGTFGPATIISGFEVDPAAHNLRLNLPDGQVVELKTVRGTFLYTTNTQLDLVTLTYELRGKSVTTEPL